MQKIIHILYFLLIPLFICGQARDEKQKTAQKAYDEGDYYSAATLFSEIFNSDTTDISIAWTLANSYRYLNDAQNAARYYQHVYRYNTTPQKDEALFWLATMQKSLGKYNEAKIHFENYYKSHQSDNSYYTIKSEQEIRNCDLSQKIISDSLPVLITHLNDKINSPYSEFSPRQIGDSLLQFSSIRPNVPYNENNILPSIYRSQIWQSFTSFKGWTAATLLNQKINNPKYHIGNSCLSPDQKKLYFTICSEVNKSTLNCEIYYSEIKNGALLSPKKLNSDINRSGYTSTQPYICSFDDKNDILWFSSNRPGSVGNMDLWYVLISKDGKIIEKPTHAGKQVNTVDNEITPFYDNRNKILYFSSNGHENLGGYDIFQSKGEPSGLSAPKNMGYPLNTSYNELYFTINTVDTNGFFTSNRPGIFYTQGATCCYDIFEYEWLGPIKNLASDSTSKKQKADTSVIEKRIKLLLPLTLYFHNDEPDPMTTETSTRKDYEATLTAYFKLKDKYKKEYSRGLKGDQKLKAEENIEKFFTEYVNTGFEKLKLFSELLLQELDSGRVVTIKVKGFCSPLASGSYNANLALRRISSMENFLLKTEGGRIAEYINQTAANGGRLLIIEEPLGEEQSGINVSDNPNDKRNSIYSRAAALERNIKILYYDSK